jgi:hypothetical protein
LLMTTITRTASRTAPMILLSSNDDMSGIRRRNQVATD